MSELIVFLASALSSLLLTRLMIAHALRAGILDVPNARSSHSRVTPRGGGVAIAATVLVGTVFCWFYGEIDASTTALLLLTGSAIAGVGYLDDRYSLRAMPRLLVHVLASALFIAGASEAQAWGGPDVVVFVILTIWIAWSINLFNFMDGTDGLAASQAIFVLGASAGLSSLNGDAQPIHLMLLSAGSCFGFLLWNRPPARIFMGDVGSGFLGFWLAGLAFLLHMSGVLSIWTSMILGALFFADASATLLVRVVTGERWYEAHRSHVYQRLVQRWRSHRKVLALAWSINLAVVLPLGALAARTPHNAPFIAAFTLIGLTVLAFYGGAGRSEVPDPSL